MFTSLGRHTTWPSFFGGMACFSLVIAAHAWAAAWTYNRLAAGPGPVKS
jgi:hypothetical protein